MDNKMKVLTTEKTTSAPSRDMGDRCLDSPMELKPMYTVQVSPQMKMGLKGINGKAAVSMGKTTGMGAITSVSFYTNFAGTSFCNSPLQVLEPQDYSAYSSSCLSSNTMRPATLAMSPKFNFHKHKVYQCTPDEASRLTGTSTTGKTNYSVTLNEIAILSGEGQNA